MADAEGGLAPELAEREAQLGETAAVEVRGGVKMTVLNAAIDHEALPGAAAAAAVQQICRRRPDLPPSLQVASGAWKQALDAVVPAVVVLKVTQTRAFDTESAGRSSATGFVVDASLGLILTNRHVVTPGAVHGSACRQALQGYCCSACRVGSSPAWLMSVEGCRSALPAGPVVAEAIFLNREEVPVVPIYYDPGGRHAACRQLGSLQAAVAAAPPSACLRTQADLALLFFTPPAQFRRPPVRSA